MKLFGSLKRKTKVDVTGETKELLKNIFKMKIGEYAMNAFAVVNGLSLLKLDNSSIVPDRRK